MPLILAIEESEIRKTAVLDQLRQKVDGTTSLGMAVHVCIWPMHRSIHRRIKVQVIAGIK
jgi:hypothetical protein